MLWLANMVQRPHSKTGVAIVLHSSREGTGKTMPFKWIGQKVIGSDWYRSTSDPVHDLFDKHSNGVENRLLVQVEEARGTDIHKNIDRLKDLITNDTCRLERKGVDAYEIANLASFVFTTNNDNSVKISPTDRRFVVFDCNEERVKDEDYFNSLSDAMRRPEMVRAMFQHLMAIDLSGVRNFEKIRPITDYYREMQRANVPNWARYMAVKAAEGEAQVKASEFYVAYTYWAERSGFGDTKLNLTAFARKVKGLAGVAAVRVTKGVKYAFDWPAVTADLKAKNMWDEEAF
jgi:phage/plasmid-associated DNA primase